MPPEEFRQYGHQVVDWIADYLAHPERYPVLPKIKPGELTGVELGGRRVGEIDVVRAWNEPAVLAPHIIDSRTRPAALRRVRRGDLRTDPEAELHSQAMYVIR